MRLVFIVGPTASGKSHFALESATYLNQQDKVTEIMNCDSLQVYQGVTIGTAKPSLEDFNRVPHHLFDFVKIGGILTAGDYRQLALKKIEECQSRGVEVLFIVGGSGFYFHALEHGMFDLGKVPESIHAQVQKEAKESLSQLYKELSHSDPEFAAKISVNDSYRIQRAVELIRTFGESPTKIRARFKNEPLSYPLTKIGFTRERSELKSIVQARAERMIKEGLTDEVSALLCQGLESWAPLGSVGYKESVRFLKKEINETELLSAIVQNTMRLAKKQMTWFKRDQDIKWFDAKIDFYTAFEALKVRLTQVGL